MKKLTTILLAVAMTLPLVACGGGNAGNTNGGNTNSGSTDKHTHVEKVMSAVEPTCTKTGLTEGKRCSECGEILVAQETVPALGRTTESGTCERCGQSFGDWRIDYSVDDFNQPTDEWYITEDEYLVGTFSNNATTNRNSHRPNISSVISGYKQPSKSAQSIEITGFIEKSKPPEIIFFYTLLPLTA